MKKIAFACLAAALAGCSMTPTSYVPGEGSRPNPYGVIILDESIPDEQTELEHPSETAPTIGGGVQVYVPDTNPSAISDVQGPVDASNLDADGLYELGRQYMEGLEVDKDELLGTHYLKLSAELGKDEAKRVLGLIGLCKDAGDPEALAMIEEAALTSNKAQMQLGFLYGDFAEPKLHDVHKAIELLEKSYQGGNPNAALFLSKLYARQGRTDLAAPALRFAADGGNAKAQSEVAISQAKKGDYSLAGKYFLMASQQGDVGAMYEYANGLIIKRYASTLRGRFAHPEEIEALAWFSRAAELGDGRAVEEVKNLRGVLPELARHGYTLDDLVSEQTGPKGEEQVE